ncbi:FT-interacting protein 1-like [Canna indica]|uniref:FT-interacting protein 1-like n=1 Tax=Canna indica TaxID=4628 RepID=A0AAQ3L037_9LILI|nr:FT-interacting protein 1-like [Canna indica]
MKVAVEVADATELMPKDGHGSANPFVEVEFDGQRHRTRTKFKDLSPAWNETFVFNVSDLARLADQTIEVTVYHDKKSTVGGVGGGGDHGHSRGAHHRNFLGRVHIAGVSIALSADDAPLLRFPLEKRGFFSNIRGDVGLRVYAMPESAAEAAVAAPLIEGEQVPVEVLENKDKKKASSSVSPEEPQVFYSVGAGGKAAAAAIHGGGSALSGGGHPHSGGGHTISGGGLAYDFAQMKQAMTGQPPVNMFHAQTRADMAPLPPTMIQVRPPPVRPRNEYDLVETAPPLASRPGYRRSIIGGEKIASTYDLVEQMLYLYVNVVKARDLPNMDITGSLDPYVELKLGNYKAKTRHLEKNRNPVWNQVFAFSQHSLQSNLLEVVVMDKDFVKDDFVGRLFFDLAEVPLRVPPDSPLAPQWYRLQDKKSEKIHHGELMLSVWMGTQADEAFPNAWHSDAHDVGLESLANTRSKVYFSPRLAYLRVIALGAQDLVPHDRHRPPANVWLKLQLGHQIQRTRAVPGTIDPTWNEELMFVASEPFDEPLVLTVEDRVAADKHEPLGRLVLPLLSAAFQRTDHHKVAEARWFSLSKPTAWDEKAGDAEKKEHLHHKFSSKIHLQLYLEMGYHVLDESTHYSSDLLPASKLLRPKQSIGILELGILDARNLIPMKTKDGRATDAYCVARYGPKWVRTRTVLNTLAPQWNEQYTWEVFDPCTVVTIAVFDNCHWTGHKDDVRDHRIGKVRIRLSTLEVDRVYAHFYPLLALHPSGLRKTGELHLAVRFTCTSWVNMVALYGKPLLPKMHYTQPIPMRQIDYLRHQAMIIVAGRLGRAEPPLRREVVEYMLDVDSHMWSLRRSKANFGRIVALLSGVTAAGRWFNAVRSWRKPITTILVHALFLILVFCPELILPTVFLYLFVVGVWNYRFRPRDPPHMDTRLSQAETTHPDELDEEADTFPTSRPGDIVRARYDRLRHVAGKVQTVVGDLATQGERVQALLSWRDPRATTIFILLSLAVAVFLYVTPFQVVAVLAGLFLLRHPRFRSRMPSVPFNFYRRLPAKSDMLL